MISDKDNFLTLEHGQKQFGWSCFAYLVNNYSIKWA